MNRLQLAALAGTLIVIAAACTVRAWYRPARPLAVVRRHLYHATAIADVPVVQRWSPTERTAARLAQSAVGEWFTTRFHAELRDTATTVPDLLARLVAATTVGFFTTTAAVAALGAVNGRILTVPALVLGVAGAVVGPVTVLSDWQRRARRRRRQFTNAVTDYIQLVAVCLTSQRSVEQAAAYAADVGDGSAFDALRTALSTAPAMGLSVWEAIDTVGVTYHLPQLRDLASSIERQATIGVTVDGTVAALAADLRRHSLDDLQREADRANATMIGPTTLFVVGVILFLAYPLAIRILDALGGA